VRNAVRLGGEIAGYNNMEAVSGAGVVILTLPLTAHAETLKSVRGNLAPDVILLDTTVPLEAAIGGRVSRPLGLWDGSAAQQAARLVPDVRVVAGFHFPSAEALARLDEPLECDVLICGDDDRAKAAVCELVLLIEGVRVVDAGPLENARLLESAAALLISLNLRYKVKSSGLRITGILPGKNRC
jgi:NADPH-dependent F420 reductase